MGVVAGSARATVVRSVARSGAISTITEAASVVLRRVNVKEVFFALFLYQGCTAMFSNSSADVAAARIDSGSDASADRLHAEARITGRIIDAGAGAMAPLVVAAPPSPTRKPRRLPELAGVRS